MKIIFYIFLLQILSKCRINASINEPLCEISKNNDRLDCYPESGANQESCIVRGCCWSEPIQFSNNFGDIPISIPYCYFPTNYPNYYIKSLRRSNGGIKAKLVRQQQTFLPNEILSLNFEVIYETKSRVRIKITDSENKRFQVPIELSPPDLSPPIDRNYEVIIPSSGQFSIEIKRKSDNQSLYKSFGPLLYSDQFIQISSAMSTGQAYGMGEQNRPFLHQLSNGWSRIGLWARDNPIETYTNLYGTHPFYMGMPENGKAFGVFYFNSNAQEFVLQPSPAITYRTIGGILDIFIFTGGTPEETVKQYVELVGKPMLPPYWSLGFHLSRYGYKNINEISQTLQRNINAGIPIDVQWSDIDYMNGHRDFTIDENNFHGFGDFLKFIRNEYNIKSVIIIDPAISNNNTENYPAYLDGIKMDIFIKNPLSNKPLVGNVWPGETVFPDFTHPDIIEYWTKQIKDFYKHVPIDGLWIDMNEPSSFVEGSTSGCIKNNRYDHPFFVPKIRDKSLISQTICSSSLHYNDVMHYNLHNLYGYTESIVTNEALLRIIPKKRPFILSRSTFSGSGKYTFHWTGDNIANWDQLKNSIRQILNFNMFGIPMVGADICGFIDASNEELCIRWMQLGSFYPFMRNHNTINVRDQDPASWSLNAQNIMKNAITNRYKLLPYFYTLLVKSHLYGGTVMRPMSFEFYTDKVTHSMDLQFMIGSSVMVAPVVHQNARKVAAYFPAGVWYEFNGGVKLHSSSEGAWLTLAAPLETINVALRGGHIIATLDSNRKSNSKQENKFSLYVAMSENMNASGELYWDDGESVDSYLRNKYSYLTFKATSDELLISPVYLGYNSLPIFKEIFIYGLKHQSISSVTLNDVNIRFSLTSTILIIRLDHSKISMDSEIKIRWN